MLPAPNPKTDPADDPSHGTHRETWGRWRDMDPEERARRARARGEAVGVSRPPHRKAKARLAARIAAHEDGAKHGGMRRPGSMKRPH